MIKLIARLDKKVGMPNYSSLGASLAIECEIDQRALDDVDVWTESVTRLYERIELAIDAELERQKIAPPQPAGQAEAAISAARSPAEPSADRNGSSNGNGHQKEHHEWGTAYRGDSRPAGGNGRDFGSPRSGKQLFAWAKGVEEQHGDGFIKALQRWCKENDLSWRFDQLTVDQIAAVYQAGQEMLEQRSAG